MLQSAEQLRQKLRDGLTDFGCRSDDDIVRFAKDNWIATDFMNRVFILALYGDHTVIPTLINIIREKLA